MGEKIVLSLQVTCKLERFWNNGTELSGLCAFKHNHEHHPPSELPYSDSFNKCPKACSVPGPVLGAEVIPRSGQLRPLLSCGLHSNDRRWARHQKNTQVRVKTKTDANRASLGQKQAQIIWTSSWASQISLQPSKLIPRVGSPFTRAHKSKSLYYKTT